MPDTPGALRQRLDTSSFFGALDAGVLDLLTPHFDALALAAGDTLCRQGAPGDAMYLVESGELDVQVEHDGGTRIVIDRLGAGAVVGEMALLTSPTRSATVVAAAPGAQVWRLARSDFEHLVTSNPAVLRDVHRVARPRLERAQLAPLLRDWFGAEADDEVHALQAGVTWQAVDQGGVLFRQGDAADLVYLVVSGRFRLLSRETDGGGKLGPSVCRDDNLGEYLGRDDSLGEFVGRGDILGEHVVLDEPSRIRTAVAVRDSQVVAMHPSVIASSPVFMRRLARSAVAKATRSRRHAPDRAIGIALVPASPGAPVAALAMALASRLRAWGEVLRLSSVVVDERFGRTGVAQSGPSDAFDLPLEMWLGEQERSHAYVLLETDATFDGWTTRSLRQVDAVVLVAAADDDPRIGELEARIAAQTSQLPTDLVLVQPDGRDQPAGTIRWLEPRNLRAHHHVRLGKASDLDRLARRLAGRALGLALSGGGARGYVHIGLLQALEERSLPLDMIVGTSMGAVVGAGAARYQQAAACIDLAKSFGDRKKVLDHTLPLVALTRSRKVSRLLQEMYGSESRIEDQWIPFACVSASLTRSEPRIHRTGLLWRAVRASAAIPGVFTPVLMDDEVLVDGGVMNNFPVDVLRDLLGPGFIIASNAYGGADRGRHMAFGDDVSGWHVLAQKLQPWRRRNPIAAPSILGTLMRSTSLSSRYLMADMDRWADLVVRYPTEGTSSLMFDGVDELIGIGYQHGAAALETWLAGADAPTARLHAPAVLAAAATAPAVPPIATADPQAVATR